MITGTSPKDKGFCASQPPLMAVKCQEEVADTSAGDPHGHIGAGSQKEGSGDHQFRRGTLCRCISQQRQEKQHIRLLVPLRRKKKKGGKRPSQGWSRKVSTDAAKTEDGH